MQSWTRGFGASSLGRSWKGPEVKEDVTHVGKVGWGSGGWQSDSMVAVTASCQQHPDTRSGNPPRSYG